MREARLRPAEWVWQRTSHYCVLCWPSSVICQYGLRRLLRTVAHVQDSDTPQLKQASASGSKQSLLEICVQASALGSLHKARRDRIAVSGPVAARDIDQLSVCFLAEGN